MGSNIEAIEVRFCDICGQKEDREHSIMKSWKSGTDCCPQHFHLVKLEGSIERMITYLSTPERDEMQDKLRALFQDFSVDRARRKE
jgi:hypothetical protein